MSEECLNLNIFTPARDDAARPVMVWIFGGGYVNGDAADPMFDGRVLAASGDVVVVTINYRLGVFGFLERGNHANLGLTDQIAALEWIRHHIDSFGGDPDNVTLFGESAGAMSICTLLTMPRANGLFHRAIAQSGAGENVATRARAAEAAELFFGFLDGDTPEALLDAQRRASIAFYEVHRRTAFRPWVDGEVLPAHPDDAAHTGADVPLIIGWNRDEQRSYINPRERITTDELLRRLESRFRGAGQRIIDFHRDRYKAPFENAAILAAADTELYYRRRARHYANARHADTRAADPLDQNTWCYRFNWASPGLKGWLGACHAIEIPFVFGNLADRTTQNFVGPGAAPLSERVRHLWCDFARSGDPGDTWPRHPATLDIHPDFRVIDAHEDDLFWDSIG